MLQSGVSPLQRRDLARERGTEKLLDLRRVLRVRRCQCASQPHDIGTDGLQSEQLYLEVRGLHAKRELVGWQILA